MELYFLAFNNTKTISYESFEIFGHTFFMFANNPRYFMNSCSIFALIFAMSNDLKKLKDCLVSLTSIIFFKSENLRKVVKLPINHFFNENINSDMTGPGYNDIESTNE